MYSFIWESGDIYIIELIMNTSCYCVLDLLCVNSLRFILFLNIVSGEGGGVSNSMKWLQQRKNTRVGALQLLPLTHGKKRKLLFFFTLTSYKTDLAGAELVLLKPVQRSAKSNDLQKFYYTKQPSLLRNSMISARLFFNFCWFALQPRRKENGLLMNIEERGA